MILDIITAALIVLPMAIGLARGVAYVAVRTLGWVGALIVSFLLTPFARGWVAKSPVGRGVYESLDEKVGSSVDSVDSATETLPQIMSGGIHEAAEETGDMIVQSLGGLIISIITFLLMVVLLRLLTMLVMRAAKKRSDVKIPVLTRMNKLAGMVVGGVEGLLLAFLFLAALIPIMNITSPDTAASIADQLKYSYLAGPLYDGNLLLAIAPFE